MSTQEQLSPFSNKWLIDTELGKTAHIYLGNNFIRYVKIDPSKYWRDKEKDGEGEEWAQCSVDIRKPQTMEEVKIIEEITKNIENELIIGMDGEIVGVKDKNKIEKVIDVVKAQSPYKKWNGNKLLLPEGFWDSWLQWYDDYKQVYFYLKDKTV